MSFTKFLYDDPLLSPTQVMRTLIQVTNELDMPDKKAAAVIAAMTCYVEVGVPDNDTGERRFWCPANHREPSSFLYPHDSESDDNRSVGYFQQQKGPNGELWWGETESMMRLHSAAESFMTRLRKLPYHIRNASEAGQFAQSVQRSAHPERYAQWHDEALELYARSYDEQVEVIGTPEAPFIQPTPHHLGDPVWLRDVVAEAGVSASEAPGAQNRGHGDFGKIWGIIIHHTGGNNSPVSEISHHPTLGLASQIHLAKNGHVTVTGVGIAYHAGYGDYPGIPRNAANGVTIGIECVNLPPRGAPHRTGWSDVQYTAMVRTCAAILVKLGHNSDRVISHQEWGGRAQGKWDPGSIDMNIFRADVQRVIDELRGGVEDMAQVPQNEWIEIRDKTRQIWGALFNRIPSQSMYAAPPKEGEGIRTKDMISGMDGTIWNERVEKLAREGVDWAIEAVVRTAAGKGRFGEDRWVMEFAASVLESIDESILKAWQEKHQTQ